MEGPYRQVGEPLDSITFIILYSKKELKRMFLTLCHTWDSNFQYSNPASMGRVVTPGGDLLDDPLYDLLTPCAGTLKTIAYTIYNTGD